MRQLIAIIVQMRRLKNEVEETDEAILRGLVEQTLSGTLPARDLFISEELNREILGKESFRRREVRLKDFLEENKSSLDIVVHDGSTAWDTPLRSIVTHDCYRRLLSDS